MLWQYMDKYLLMMVLHMLLQEDCLWQQLLLEMKHIQFKDIKNIICLCLLEMDLKLNKYLNLMDQYKDLLVDQQTKYKNNLHQLLNLMIDVHII